MMSAKKIVFVMMTLVLFACNDDEDNRFERIDKLRALGVTTSPIGLTPAGSDGSQAMTLSFFLVAPLGSTLQFEPYEDEKSRFAIPVKLSVAETSDKRTDYATFSIHQIDAVLTPPPAGLFPIPEDPGFVRLRYGLRVTAANEEEVIVGTAVLYANNTIRPSYQPLSVQIVTPESQGLLGNEATIAASVDNPNDENVKIGWFVSSGQVKNRRARQTIWSDIKGGKQTMIVTVRGLKSGTFAFDVREFNGS